MDIRGPLEIREEDLASVATAIGFCMRIALQQLDGRLDTDHELRLRRLIHLWKGMSKDSLIKPTLVINVTYIWDEQRGGFGKMLEAIERVRPALSRLDTEMVAHTERIIFGLFIKRSGRSRKAWTREVCALFAEHGLIVIFDGDPARP